MAIGEHSKKKNGKIKISYRRKSTCHSMAIGGHSKKEDGEIKISIQNVKLMSLYGYW